MSKATAIVRTPGEGIANHAFRLPRHLLITADDTNGQSSMWIEEVPPGAGPPRHIHRHEDETFHILAGSFRFAAADESSDVPAGSTIHIPRGVPHTFKNVGEEPGRLLVTMTPGGFERFFLAIEAEGLVPETDVARITELADCHGLSFTGPPL